MSIINGLIPERLSNFHNINQFKCEAPSLNNFLKKDAIEHQRQRISFTTVYLHDGNIAGYVTLATDSITLELDSDIDDLDTRFPQIPALKICRIARDLKYTGCGVGVHMLEDAIAFAHSLNRSENILGVGCRFVMVDIRDTSLIYGFYIPNGFEHHTSSQDGKIHHYRFDLGTLRYDEECESKKLVAQGNI